MAKKNTAAKLYTYADLQDPFENPFKSDIERIKYMKKNYGHMTIAESFATFYNQKIDKTVKNDPSVNNPVVMELGKTYTGKVTQIDKNGIILTVPGVKEEIISKENFSDCMTYVENYLLNHDNELSFMVRDKRDGRFYVSVLEGYYDMWRQEIDRAIELRGAIKVHIDNLVRGGYMCHTDIWTLNELTGKNYTSVVFIPGSNIVLNIETDFEKWVGQDVDVVPQKFTKFRAHGKPTENSIIGSRKMVLKIQGMKNMYEIYNRAKLANLPGVKYTPEKFTGKVTGIINSNNKCGVFLEIEDMCITGLMPVPERELLQYKPGNYVEVIIKEFEQQEDRPPFFIDKRSIIRQCNIRPVFEKA